MRPRHLDVLLAALALLASATANGYGTDQRDGAGSARAARDCLRCHRIEGHSVGIEPARVLPAAYALDRNGRLTCATCHAVSRQTAPVPTDACSDCHDRSFFDGMRDAGLSVRGRAHAPAPHPSPDEPIDSISADCLGCHADHAGPRHAGDGRNHPIGSDYRIRAAYGGYVAEERLPPQVRLPQGRVGCGSCHRAYSAEHGALVLGASTSDLCFACHDL